MRLAEKQNSTLNFLAELGDAQVAHGMLRRCVNSSRLNYMARTTPCDATREAATAFDRDAVEAFAAASRTPLTERQRLRAGFAVWDGGLGLRPIGDRVDAAYIASRAATHELCRAISAAHSWNVDSPDDPLHEACVSRASYTATSTNSAKPS